MTTHAFDDRDRDLAPEDDTYIGVRSEVATYLDPSTFPADKQALLATATENNADENVLRLLNDLPEDTTFNTTQEVVDALPFNRSQQPDG